MEFTKRFLTYELYKITVVPSRVQLWLSEYFFRSFVHFQSYKSFTDKGSGIFPDLASTTSLMLGRGSISSNEAPSAADEGELGKWKIVLCQGTLRDIAAFS